MTNTLEEAERLAKKVWGSSAYINMTYDEHPDIVVYANGPLSPRVVVLRVHCGASPVSEQVRRSAGNAALVGLCAMLRALEEEGYDDVR